jgi:hypothetical protein
MDISDLSNAIESTGVSQFSTLPILVINRCSLLDDLFTYPNETDYILFIFMRKGNPGRKVIIPTMYQH